MQDRQEKQRRGRWIVHDCDSEVDVSLTFLPLKGSAYLITTQAFRSLSLNASRISVAEAEPHGKLYPTIFNSIISCQILPNFISTNDPRLILD
jgi:hypothetical protein